MLVAIHEFQLICTKSLFPVQQLWVRIDHYWYSLDDVFLHLFMSSQLDQHC